jgi:hypothetical protein
MPRQPPELTLISIPRIERGKSLSQMYDFAGLLGFSKLRDDVAGELSHIIALAEAGADAVEGLTPRKRAATFKRYAKKLRREQMTGRSNSSVRLLLSDPRLGLDTETFLLLEPLAAAPVTELLAAVEARQRDLDRQSRTSPQREALVSAGGAAVWFFLVHAGDNVRDEPGAWWRFVLAVFAVLGADKFKTEARPLLNELRVAAGPLARTVRAAPQNVPFIVGQKG